MNTTVLAFIILLICSSNCVVAQSKSPVYIYGNCFSGCANIVSVKKRTDENFKESVYVKIQNKTKKTIVAVALAIASHDVSRVVKNSKVRILALKTGQVRFTLTEYEAAINPYINYSTVKIEKVIYSDGSTYEGM